MSLIEFCSSIKNNKLSNNEMNRIEEILYNDCEDKMIKIIFTDGACSKNGKQGAKAGVGIYIPTDNYSYFKELNEVLIEENIEPLHSTNQRAELTAILKALVYINCNDIVKKALIHTDSLYSINCITKWNKNWEKNNWMNAKGASVLNQDIIKPILKLINNLEDKCIDITFKHVRGHIKKPSVENSNKDNLLTWYGNYKADILAVQSIN